jgi:hypothetical protein
MGASSTEKFTPNDLLGFLICAQACELGEVMPPMLEGEEKSVEGAGSKRITEADKTPTTDPMKK